MILQPIIQAEYFQVYKGYAATDFMIVQRLRFGVYECYYHTNCPLCTVYSLHAEGLFFRMEMGCYVCEGWTGKMRGALVGGCQ